VDYVNCLHQSGHPFCLQSGSCLPEETFRKLPCAAPIGTGEGRFKTYAPTVRWAAKGGRVAANFIACGWAAWSVRKVGCGEKQTES
jgi:hypothetical protein